MELNTKCWVHVKSNRGYIYETIDQAIDQAKEQIQATSKDKVGNYGPIWEIIDIIWNNQLHCPTHGVRYFLNTRYHYKAQLGEDQIGEGKDGLHECLECMVSNESEQLEYINRAMLSLGLQVPLVET